jgi:bifunctional UDP-N-acetylglucosamine pyrophosphorylase/glucosamine-1-phosphate N-acetyltransferase
MEKKSVLILAAGLGKRMCSSHPKVLHLSFGKPMIFHQLSRIQEAFSQVSVGIVVGYGKQEIQDAIEKEKKFFNLNLSFIFQEKQQGTGDAVKCALASSWGQEQIKLGRDLIVLPGDVPFISSALPLTE